MKIIMKFNLPEDEYEYKMAVNGHNYYHALDDIMEHMRAEIKYNNGELSDDKLAAYEELYEKFYQILDERNVRLYD